MGAEVAADRRRLDAGDSAHLLIKREPLPGLAPVLAVETGDEAADPVELAEVGLGRLDVDAGVLVVLVTVAGLVAVVVLVVLGQLAGVDAEPLCQGARWVSAGARPMSASAVPMLA
ncbi:hypothetical protein [Nannocystis pusilla]|uniref:hypothetical protein n=1 Tax=Nannocystis pusilla TaxID=889268 RepID=UPI003B776673